jgi:hypothetical protein
MHKFWYHSPLRFYKTKEELSDMTNPQNCQFFGAKNPYPLEKGELHRFLIPNIDNEIINSNNFVGRNLILNSELKGVISGLPYLDLSEPLIAGQEYTLSFTAKKENPNSGVGWVSVQRVNDWTAEQLNVRVKITDSEYKEYKATFIAKSTAIEQKIWVYSDDNYKIDFKKGIKLEKGNKATDWSPAHEDEDYETNLKLFLVGDTEQEIQSLMTVIDDKLCAVTFKCDDFVQGHFEIRNYSEPVFYSNCVKFIDSTDSDGRKYIRIATKHNYDKNLFPYSKSPNLYCVTNLPAYDLGRFTAEVDAKNSRVGNSASLISSEWYVTSTEAGEWMEWKELPYAAGDITVKVCYAAKEDAKIRFDFGEGTKRRQGPVVELPATGGEWVTVDAFTMKSDVNGWRRTVLNIVAGKPDLNYFTITVEK